MESCYLLVQCIIVFLICIFNKLGQNERITYYIEHFPHCFSAEIMFTKIVRKCKCNDVRYG